ncbi:MAG: GntR family transcriptional regulator [Acidobacteriota bacterium]|nr:GntR family transcriptional regulator [Acidobacteriota bacterium]
MELLLSGRLRPNDVVMERRLAATLGLSRTPLREAIRRLEGEKLLHRQDGGTIIVSPMSAEDILNVLHVRRLVEGEAARRAAGRMPVQELVAFRKRIVAAKAETIKADGTPNTLGRELHLRIALASGNPVLESVIVDLGKRTRLFMRIFERRTEVRDEHLAIVEALANGDGEAARAAMERHIDNMRLYILDKLASL